MEFLNAKQACKTKFFKINKVDPKLEQSIRVIDNVDLPRAVSLSQTRRAFLGAMDFLINCPSILYRRHFLLEVNATSLLSELSGHRTRTPFSTPACASMPSSFI